jgi:DNA-binding SARP family transcriptional activator
MGKLSLYLLGDLRIEINNEPIENIPTDKARALLVYLALEGERPLHRDVLAEMFWPERPSGVGRANLRQAVGSLRSALGDRNAPSPFIHARRDHIQLNTDENVWIDAVAVHDLLRTVRDHDHQPGDSCQECETSLVQVLDLFKGEFLAELSLPSSQGFNEWAAIQREALHRQITTTMRLLVGLLEARGAYEEACRQARKLISHEPWSEGNHQILMRLLAIAGRRSQAMRQFRTCQRILFEEFDVAPSDETLALLQQIRDGQLESLKTVPDSTSVEPEGKIVRHAPRWQRYGAMILAITTIIALGGFGMLNLGVFNLNIAPQPATNTQAHLNPQIAISTVDLTQYSEVPYGNSIPSRICGEEAFDGNLHTQDPLFIRRDGFFDGWISLDPSTVVLPDNSSVTYSIPLVLVVIDLPWVQIQGAMTDDGIAHAWGCWYTEDQHEQVVEDAILDLCMKHAGGQFAVLHRVSAAGFEELGTTETITCP